MSIQLEPLTEQHVAEIQQIDRSDIPEAFVDNVDTLMALHRYGREHGCIGRTFVIRVDGACAGVLLLGEAIPWETDPPEMQREPFYRLMCFVIDKKYRGLGIGSQALEEAIRRVYDDYGVRPVALGVHRENVRAAAFYMRNGFRPTDAMEGSDRYYVRYPGE